MRIFIILFFSFFALANTSFAQRIRNNIFIESEDGRYFLYKESFTQHGKYYNAVYDRTTNKMHYAGIGRVLARMFNDKNTLLALQFQDSVTVMELSNFRYKKVKINPTRLVGFTGTTLYYMEEQNDMKIRGIDVSNNKPVYESKLSLKKYREFPYGKYSVYHNYGSFYVFTPNAQTSVYNIYSFNPAADSATLIANYTYSDFNNEFIVSKDNRYMLLSSPRGTALYDVQQQKQLWLHDAPAYGAINFNCNQDSIIIMNKNYLEVRDLRSGKVKREIYTGIAAIDPSVITLSCNGEILFPAGSSWKKQDLITRKDLYEINYRKWLDSVAGEEKKYVYMKSKEENEKDNADYYSGVVQAAKDKYIRQGYKFVTQASGKVSNNEKIKASTHLPTGQILLAVSITNLSNQKHKLDLFFGTQKVNSQKGGVTEKRESVFGYGFDIKVAQDITVELSTDDFITANGTLLLFKK